MPEINPYEPPQTQLSRALSEKLPTTARTIRGRYLVPSLIGLQVTAGGLVYLFHVMYALAHSNYQRWQTLAEVFAFSFLGLGLLLILIALWRGSIKLLIGEVLTLGIVLWSTLQLPVIH